MVSFLFCQKIDVARLKLKFTIAGLFNSFDGYSGTEITCIINRVHQYALLVS